MKFLGKTLFVERAKLAPEKDVIAKEDSKIANTDKVIEVLDVPPPPPPFHLSKMFHRQEEIQLLLALVWIILFPHILSKIESFI